MRQSSSAKRELEAWIATAAKRIARKSVPSGIKAVFGPEDAELVALTAMTLEAENRTELPWLYVCGRNAVLSEVRALSLGPRGTEEPVPMDEVQVGSLPDTRNGPAECLSNLMSDELLSTLKPRVAHIIRLTDLDGHTNAEVGAAYGLTARRIAQLRQAGLERLRAKMESQPSNLV